MLRLQFGHTGLNMTTYKIGNHDAGCCDCGHEVEAVMSYCPRCDVEKKRILSLIEM